MIFSREVLPEPFGPLITVILPGRAEKLRLENTVANGFSKLRF